MMQVACNSAGLNASWRIRSGFFFGSDWMVCVYTEHTGQIDERECYGSVALAAVRLLSLDSRFEYSEASGLAWYI